MSFDELGTPIFPPDSLEATVHVFNDGFAPAVVDNFTCDFSGSGWAGVFGETNASNRLLKRTHAVEFDYTAVLKFYRNSGNIVPPTEGIDIVYAYRNSQISLPNGEKFDSVRSLDFSVRLKAEFSCQLESRFADRLGEPANIVVVIKDFFSLPDIRSVDGIALLQYLLQREIEDRILKNG